MGFKFSCFIGFFHPHEKPGQYNDEYLGLLKTILQKKQAQKLAVLLVFVTINWRPQVCTHVYRCPLHESGMKTCL